VAASTLQKDVRRIENHRQYRGWEAVGRAIARRQGRWDCKGRLEFRFMSTGASKRWQAAREAKSRVLTKGSKRIWRVEKPMSGDDLLKSWSR
jgi:hypothetical protein